ncbi:MAG: membrane protein YqaA with SNARE-associated domain [Kiritimatiellia bacterium]
MPTHQATPLEVPVASVDDESTLDSEAMDRPAAIGMRLSWSLLGQAALGLLAILGVAGLVGWLFRAPIMWAGSWFIDTFGLAGLGFATLVIDAFPLPLSNEPLMVLALGGEVSIWMILLVMASASTLAGMVGYGLGRTFGAMTPLGGWISRRYPGLQIFMRRWGALGVAIAAATPIPFSLATWTAGMTKVNPGKVLLASTVRIPKTAFYLWLVAQGWALGGAGPDPSVVDALNAPDQTEAVQSEQGLPVESAP